MDDNEDGEDFARESEHDRIIRLTGDISEETSEKFVLSLYRVAKEPGEIDVVVSSNGGDIEEGLRIIDAMDVARKRGCPIHTIVSGKAYSMAAIIASCGDRRTIYTHSRMMFHTGRFDGVDEDKPLTTAELERMHDDMSVCDCMFRELLAAAGISDVIIDRLLKPTDTYLKAEETISLGLMHSIETSVI